MGITLDTIREDLHAIAIKDSTNGYELAIDSNGKINAKIEDDGNSITVDAVNLDIRDLTSASDNVEIKTAAGQALSIDGSGYLTVNQGTSPWVVSATDLDIRDLTHVSDSVKVGDGTDFLAIDGSGNIGVTQATSPWVVSATDFDIRDLDYTQDNVEIKDAGGDALAINADGSINVVGDIEVTSSGYDTWQVTQATVTSTESELVSTPLTGRLRIEIQNLGTQDCYLKEATGVTSANGMKLNKGSSFEQDLDDGANIFAITASGTTDLRIAEYSA